MLVENFLGINQWYIAILANRESVLRYTAIQTIHDPKWYAQRFSIFFLLYRTELYDSYCKSYDSDNYGCGNFIMHILMVRSLLNKSIDFVIIFLKSFRYLFSFSIKVLLIGSLGTWNKWNFIEFVYIRKNYLNQKLIGYGGFCFWITWKM